jgi:hypothetical protein
MYPTVSDITSVLIFNLSYELHMPQSTRSPTFCREVRLLQPSCKTHNGNLSLCSPLDLGRIFSFLIYTQSLGLLGQGISPSQGGATYTQKTQTRNKRTQTSMPWVGFEPTILMFGLAQTVHRLDSAATVIAIMEIVNRFVEWFVKFLDLMRAEFFYKWIRESFVFFSIK